ISGNIHHIHKILIIFSSKQVQIFSLVFPHHDSVSFGYRVSCKTNVQFIIFIYYCLLRRNGKFIHTKNYTSSTSHRPVHFSELKYYKLDARLMGADPTASPVTGECSTVELQPQVSNREDVNILSCCEHRGCLYKIPAIAYKLTDFYHLINLVSTPGLAPGTCTL